MSEKLSGGCHTLMEGRVGNFCLEDQFGNYAGNFFFCFVNEFDGNLKSMPLEMYETLSIQTSKVSESFFGLIGNFHQSQGLLKLP